MSAITQQTKLSPCQIFRLQIKGKLHKALREIPWWVVAITVAGVASLVLCPAIAPAFLGFAGALILTRYAVKLIDHCFHKCVSNVQDKMIDLREKHPWIEYIALIIAALVSFIFPLAGFIMAACIGVYKGIPIEAEITEHKRHLNEKKQENAPKRASPTSILHS